jgi:hypothetical protein
MGILDPKVTIYDVVITDKGRELLAEGKLNFIYYAFSDQGINYSGSLCIISGTNVPSGTTLDDYLHRNFSFEADQRIGSSIEEPKDLNSFLYTVSNTSKTIPELKISESGSIQLKRTNTKILTKDIHKVYKQKKITDYSQVFIKTTQKDKTLLDAKKSYANDQFMFNILKKGK